MSYVERFKEEFSSKEKFHSSFVRKKLVTKSAYMFLRFRINLKPKQ